MKLAEMLDTSTSYIGEIEINSRVPSLAMVERIANALKIEPFRLFLDNNENLGENIQKVDHCLEDLPTKERQALAQHIKNQISNEIDKILQPENIE